MTTKKKTTHLLLWCVLSLLAPLLVTGCSDQPWRYDPGVPAGTAGLVATAGNHQVSLAWAPAQDAASYNVYYSTSPQLTNPTVLRNVNGTSVIVTALDNDVTYHFSVAAVTSSGEGTRSGAVTAAPSAPGPFLQSDLEGTWAFNALTTGADAKWMRGTAVIDGAGAVSVSGFLDSAGAVAAPAGLFGTLTILPDGAVLRPGAPEFHGVLSPNQFKDLLVATASDGSASPTLMVLQRRLPGMVFSSSDIQGTGQAVAGPLTWVYHQLSAGVTTEWEHAAGQTGRDQSETYAAIAGSTARQLPGAGNKVVSMSITSDGIVSETPLPGVQPVPALLLDRGVMSADKMTIVGTATDSHGAAVLRIMQLIHPPSILLTSTSYALPDLAGAYTVHLLTGGNAPLWAHAALAVDGSGSGSYASYRDSSGNSALPAPFTLAMDLQGVLTNPALTSYNGKVSYFKDAYVATGTDAAGAAFLSIGVKR